MFAALTGAGLSAAAGLNAWIPFLIVAITSRYTDFLNLPQQYAWIESGWAIAIASCFLVSELVLDKIAVVDHFNDAVGTFIRPLVGGLIFTASAAAKDLETSQWAQDNQWALWLAGIFVAGTIHGTKAAARPMINTATAGLGTPITSIAEDTTAVGVSLSAIFVPLLILLLGGPIFLGLLWLAFSLWRKRRSGAGAEPRVI